MNREQLIDRINYLLNREGHSLSAYVLEAEPYVETTQKFAIRELKSIVDDEEARADRLRLLMEEEIGVAPADSTFLPVVADMNYLSLYYLIGILVKDKTRLVEEYEDFLAHIAGVSDYVPIRDVVSQALKGSAAILARLRALDEKINPPKEEVEEAPAQEVSTEELDS
jgi:hypothetical protein